MNGRIKRSLIAGAALSVIACVVFIITRQPYAGIICFSILAVKAYLMIRSKSNGK